MINKKSVVLLIVDPTVGFLEGGGGQPSGGLVVPMARHIMDKAAQMMAKIRNNVSKIVTLVDSHPETHISLPIGYWKKQNGTRIVPFKDFTNERGITVITSELFENGEVYCSWAHKKSERDIKDKHNDYDWTEHYLKELSKINRECEIWPTHQVHGTIDTVYHDRIGNEILEWCTTKSTPHIRIEKGRNYRTEMYSGIRAAVIDPLDPTTGVNKALISLCNNNNVDVYLFGIAGSHCVKWTGLDLIKNISQDNRNNIHVIEDLCPVVENCDFMKEEFLQRVTNQGANVIVSSDL